MIGILTFHHVYNYGALLQAYGLQKYLESVGVSSIIADVRPFHREPPGVAHPKITLRYINKGLKFLGLKKPSIKERLFDDFRNNQLYVSEQAPSLDVFLNHNKDVSGLIVGSDQVWGAKFGKAALNVYFCKGVDNGISRVSYAACIGSTKTRESDILPFVDDLNAFKAVGVRDEFSKDLITNIYSGNVSRVVDPTLLIDWSDIAEKVDIDLPGDFAFYYGRSPAGDEIVKSLKEKKGLNVVSVGMENDRPFDMSDFHLNDAGPLEWLAAMKKSSFVVTTSFHGLMLALSLKKPVLATPVSALAAERISDAAAWFGATEVVLSQKIENSDLDVDRLLNNINWDVVYKNIEEKVRLSKHFLDGALHR
ncbi:polysaccharide pyruvyl transferase family protein [Halomonas nitroreducens]|uniref:Polysaccharide pyruvyl transferase family protein n=1 Tax=Halomonas nitroreducens TaxID=447425 RepID=A0A431UYW3_9GAMM|nr:polysaccharide pyruvyl transferase family protein [Halomonas nitroreducens]RTQ97316.1 polysaccharide pyruvyl transferase family protein [Halomonas nitroreducens]